MQTDLEYRCALLKPCMPGIDTISVFVRAAIFLFGLVIFGQGNKSLGTIVAISSYASYFWQPIMNLGNIFNILSIISLIWNGSLKPSMSRLP